MRKYLVLLIAVLLAGWMSSFIRVFAQAATPSPNGEVSGRIINQNQGMAVTESLEVMLHIWDKNNADINMLHAQSAPDGTFRFTGVELQSQYLYGVMAVFNGVTYLSQILPPVDRSNKMEFDVPVYETTKDTSTIQANQFHVLFNFAEDGLEITEIYSLTNTGKRTIKDAVRLDDGKLATLRYPLPADADYIFFQPDEQDRFIKFPGGFADTSPILPGERTYEHAVKYLVPFSQGQAYNYTAPLNIKAMNFLLPENAGLLLKGEGLAGPQPVKLDNGVTYVVYAYSDIHAGQTISVTFSGKPALGVKDQSGNLTLPLTLGGSLLGLAMIGAGFWWWRRPVETDDDINGDEAPDEMEFDQVLNKIARLDKAHDNGEIEEEEYTEKRQALLQQAKVLMKQKDD